MSEKPIIFSGPMVRAILEVRKTQTRRVHPKARYTVGDHLWVRETWGIDPNDLVGGPDFCKDRVVYRASWPHDYLDVQHFNTDQRPAGEYQATGEYHWGWHPSIHMPKWAARIWLEVTGVRCERLQEISWSDSKSEGAQSYIYPACGDHPDLEGWITSADGETGAAHVTPIEAFANLWDSINAKRGYGWDTNPTVYVYEFKQINP